MEFKKREWSQANMDHYGQDFAWDGGLFFLEAYEGKEIVGSLTFKLEEGVGYVSTIIVAKNARGQGIGKKMMEQVESIALEKKAHKVFLFTGKGWGAVEFYESLGYVVTVELPNFYHKKDFLLMSKLLETAAT